MGREVLGFLTTVKYVDDLPVLQRYTCWCSMGKVGLDSATILVREGVLSWKLRSMSESSKCKEDLVPWPIVRYVDVLLWQLSCKFPHPRGKGGPDCVSILAYLNFLVQRQLSTHSDPRDKGGPGIGAIAEFQDFLPVPQRDLRKY